MLMLKCVYIWLYSVQDSTQLQSTTTVVNVKTKAANIICSISVFSTDIYR